MLQFGFPRLNALFLFEGNTVNPVLARVRDPVRVVRIHLCLRLLLDRRLKLRRLVDDRETVFIDRLSDRGWFLRPRVPARTPLPVK